MLKTHTLPLGSYQTNCYIIHDENSKSCCIIDPGYTPEIVLDYLEEKGLTAQAILLTHGHFDHVGGVRQNAAETPMMTAGPLFYTKTYGEGDQLNLAGLQISVLHTPGHTPGSVCLIIENSMFSGDTLFAGSCGRTDLPGGSWAAITKSLRRLASFQTNYWVFPGHGESTTLAEEKRYNPYLK